MIIYKITNKINNKVYIGQTVQSLSKRFWAHCNNDSCPVMHAAIKKYGKENFAIEQIDSTTSNAELDEKEIYWIAFYNSIVPNGYNRTAGGHCGANTNEQREKLKRAHLGKRHSDDARKKMSASHMGYKYSEFAKEKMSIARKGLNLSEKTKQKMSAAKTGDKNPLSKRIVCVETGEIFACMSQAEKTLSVKNVWAVCNGKRKTAGGLHFKYFQLEGK